MNSVSGNTGNGCLLQDMVMKFEIALLVGSIKLSSLQNRMIIGKTSLDIWKVI